MKKGKITFLSLLGLMTLALTGCGSSEDEGYQYASVQLSGSDMWSIIDVNSGEIVCEDEFKNVPRVVVNGKFCVENGNGKIDFYDISDIKKAINKEGYKEATSFSQSGRALAVLPGQPIMVINDNCEKIADLPKNIRQAVGFSHGYAGVVNDDQKCGFIDEDGKVVVELKYDAVTSFSSDNIAIAVNVDTTTAAVNAETGAVDADFTMYAINPKGDQLFKLSSEKYKDIPANGFHNGYLAAQTPEGRVDYLNEEGEKQFSIGDWEGEIPNWLGVYNGLSVYKDGDVYGLKDTKGETVLRAKYEALMPIIYTDGKLYMAEKNNQYGVIDSEGNEVIKFDYMDLLPVNAERLFATTSHTSVTLLDTEGKEITKKDIKTAFISVPSAEKVTSDYYDYAGLAQKIMANITANSFYGIKKGETFGQIRSDLTLEEPNSWTTNFPGVIDGHEMTVCFADPVQPIYGEDYYGYASVDHYEYNDAAVVNAAIISEKFNENWPADTKEKVMVELDKLITKAGFTKDSSAENLYLNKSTGTGIALEPQAGNEMQIGFAFDISGMIPQVPAALPDSVSPYYDDPYPAPVDSAAYDYDGDMEW